MIDTLTGETWRFYVEEETGEVLRARLYQIGDDGGDRWRWYWEGDFTTAFVDYYRDGYTPLTDNGEEVSRAIYALDCVKGEQVGASTSTEGHPLWRNYDALDRVAVRISGSLDAGFVTVPLDRGALLYMLTWDGDTNHVWRNEVEAIYNGDVWCVETEEYAPGMGPGGSDWVSTDSDEGEWNGEDYARRMYEKAFPLSEFPAERFVGASN